MSQQYIFINTIGQVPAVGQMNNLSYICFLWAFSATIGIGNSASHRSTPRPNTFQLHDIRGQRLSPSAERYVYHFGAPLFALRAKSGAQKKKKYLAAAGNAAFESATA